MMPDTTVRSDLQSAIALHQSGRLKEAATIYKQVLDTDPANGDALHLLGLVSHQSGQSTTAIALIKRALEVSPDHPDFSHNLANILRESGQFKEAIQVYRRIIELHSGSAEVYNNLGISLYKLNLLEEAVTAYHETLAINPHYAEAYYNLGMLLQKQGKLEEAVTAYHEALAINPHYAEVYNNLGHMLHKQRKLDGAFQLYQKAVSLKPDFLIAHRNLGDVLSQQGKIKQAIQSYDKAIEIQPNNAKAHHHLGMLLLLQGDFQRGWKEYEWRLKCNDFPVEKRSFSQPVWDGSPLNGKTIFLYAEQGFGDTIQFIRYVYELTRYKVDIIVECQSELLSLFRNIGVITQLIVQGDALPDFDVHAPLLSLPRILGTDLESIPSKVPYLSAKPVSVFRSDPNSKLKVGIVWAGNSWHPNDDTRSVDLQQFTILFKVSACQFYSLQVGDRRNDIFNCNYSVPVIDLGANFSDFFDTASAIIELDLVISVDTSVAHLAGALGKNVWVLLSWIPDWRWLLEKEDTLWYPTMRLFRQTRNGDWESAFQRVQLALKQYVLKSRDLY